MSGEPSDGAAARSGWRIAAGVVGVIELLAILPTGFFAMMSVMMFDAPGSDQNSLAWALFWGTWTLPLACLIGGILALIAAARFTPRRLGIAIGLPALNVAYIGVMLASLEQQCGGSFACGH